MKDTTTYCIRCGNVLQESEARYPRDDPDHEEPMCHNCYERYERMNESEE